jgi:hypothetical protein
VRQLARPQYLAWLAVLALCVAPAAAAEVPRYEVFVGYTHVRWNTETDLPSLSSNGGGGQFAYNFDQWLGVVADLGVVHNGNIGGFKVDSNTANFLFGPRISLRHSRLRPYFQLLWGAVYLTASTQINILTSGANSGQPVTARIGTQQSAFAMAVGGGLDIRLNKHVSFRPFALDYYMNRFQNLRSQSDNNQNNIRYTTGFNFMFGAH